MPAMLGIYPEVDIFIICLLGLMIGSFLNVVIVRLPKHMLQSGQTAPVPESASALASPPVPAPVTAPVPASASSSEIPIQQTTQSSHPWHSLLWPGSHCVSCKTPIKSFDNIPLLSFILLNGQCRSCKAPISFRYPITELLTMSLSLVIYLHFGYGYATLGALIFTWILIALAGIDFDYFILPNGLTFSLLWLGLFLNSFNLYTNAQSAILGAIGGYLSLWVVYWVFKLLTHKDAIGYGDFKLLAALGAWVGWQGLLQIILVASLLGAIVGGTYIIFAKKDKNTIIPFGPFLGFAGFITLLWGQGIMDKIYYLMLVFT